MKLILCPLLATALLAAQACAQNVIFQDDFKGKLGEGWSWVREHREAWRLTDRGLEVRVEPGNMWGGQNDARNLLLRPAPLRTNSELEMAVTVENKPTHQYEQVNLVWFYDDSHMVKLGQELVDGKLSIVMGREEKDQCRTIAIIPLSSDTVRIRLFAKGNQLRGQFRTPFADAWQDVGETSMPAPPNGTPKICLQFYQGPRDAEHWARVSDFQILEHRGTAKIDAVRVLVAFYSLTGNTEKMAAAVAEGVQRTPGVIVHAKSVDKVAKEDLVAADALILGCPTYYGSIPGKMKAVIDDWSWKWKVDFTDKAGGAFSTGGGQVGGKEFVVVSLLMFMINNRMVIAGPFYRNDTTGSVWGEAGAAAMTGPLDPDVGEGELDSARRLGERVARLAGKLKAGRNAPNLQL